ncbi:MAG: hypothetical protein KBA14_02415 [Saprospiraceae bacterium]|nr:hypothetical protein [Saprospiraceae bacterium]
MEDPVLLEWIDQYLMGSIRPEDKTELERMMASDPEIAEMVEESRKTFNVLRAARNHQLREKLKALDKDDLLRSGFLPHWIIVMICILVIMGGSWCWGSYYFSNKAIAVRYFKLTYQPEKQIALQGEMKKIWEEANSAFSKEDYGQAYNLYNSILESTEQSVQYSARWNLLLSDLALHGQTVDWKEALETFAWEAPEPSGYKAQELSRLLHSGWYKIMVFLTQTDISGLKPRLI